MSRTRYTPSRSARKNRVSSYLIAFIPLLILVVVVIYMLLSPQGSQIQEQKTYQALGIAPDFTLNVITPSGLTDEKFTLSSLRNKVVLLDFALSWCPHCNNMEPVLKKLYNDYRVRGVEFVTVAGDDELTDEVQTAEFVARHSIPWKVVFDVGLSVFTKYGIRGTPTYVVIDRHGNVVTILEGEQSYSTLSSALETALMR